MGVGKAISFAELVAKRFDTAVFLFYVVGASFGAMTLSLLALVVYLFIGGNIAIGIIALVPTVLMALGALFCVKVIGIVNAAVAARGTLGAAVDFGKGFRK